MRKIILFSIALSLLLCSCAVRLPSLIEPETSSPAALPKENINADTKNTHEPTAKTKPSTTPKPASTPELAAAETPEPPLPDEPPPVSMPEPTPPEVQYKSGPLVKMADGRHIHLSGADIHAGAEALQSFEVKSEYCSELTFLIRRGRPNSTDVVVIDGDNGYNLLFYYEQLTRAFDDDYEISSKYSVQLTLYDLDYDGADEVLLFVGNGNDDTEMVIFEIRADGLEHIGGLYSVNCFEIDGDIIKYAFYSLDSPFETSYKDEQFVVIRGTFPENAS